MTALIRKVRSSVTIDFNKIFEDVMFSFVTLLIAAVMALSIAQL